MVSIGLIRFKYRTWLLLLHVKVCFTVYSLYCEIELNLVIARNQTIAQNLVKFWFLASVCFWNWDPRFFDLVMVFVFAWTLLIMLEIIFELWSVCHCWMLFGFWAMQLFNLFYHVFKLLFCLNFSILFILCQWSLLCCLLGISITNLRITFLLVDQID